MRPLYLAAVFLAMVALLALRLYDPSRPAAPEAPEAPGDSDYYLLEAEIRQMDGAGALQYRIRAAESLHYPDDSVRLNEIDVAYVGGERGPWRLTAPRGKVSPGSRDIRLEGGVALSHRRDGGPGMRLTTDYAWIRPESERIDTEAAVAATLADQRARAAGMTVYLDSNRLRLHRDVRVVYAP